MPFLLRKTISKFFQSCLPIGMKGKKTFEFFGTDFNNFYPNISEFYNLKETKRLFNETVKISYQDENMILNPTIPIDNLITSSKCF